MGRHTSKEYFAILIFILISIFAGFVAYHRLEVDLTDQDIYYAWVEGSRITNGENPYSRIHESDMLVNDKYATYFPLFYELSALSIKAGFAQFADWVGLWRGVFLLSNIGVALLVYTQFHYRGWYLLGLLACIIWFFNRWTLYVTFVVHLDIFAILLFLLSLHLFPKARKLSLLLFSLSLAIKQIAIFVIPLILIWTAIEHQRKKRLFEVVQATVIMVSVPFLSSLPFLINDFYGFIKSILFSFTREPTLALKAIDLSNYLQLTGAASRIPLIIVMSIIFIVAWRFKLPKYLLAFLVMVAFTEFNPVSISQYMVWTMALLPFVVFELYDIHSKSKNIRELKPA